MVQLAWKNGRKDDDDDDYYSHSNKLINKMAFNLIFNPFQNSANKTSACSSPDNGGCSDICIPLKGGARRCACPTFGGLSLGKDAKICSGKSFNYLTIISLKKMTCYKMRIFDISGSVHIV